VLDDPVAVECHRSIVSSVESAHRDQNNFSLTTAQNLHLRNALLSHEVLARVETLDLILLGLDINEQRQHVDSTLQNHNH
jgi:hypothetical protein